MRTFSHPEAADAPPLRVTRVLRPLLLAEVISTTGAQLSLIALPWLVLTTTGSPAKMGWVMAAQLAPVALFGGLGGTWAGRVGPHRWMVLSDLVRGLLVIMIATLYFVGLLFLPVLLTLVFAIGFFEAPYMASQQTILADLVGEDERTLGHASSLFQGAVRTTLLLGPPAAAGMITLFGAPTVLILSTVVYLAAALLVLRAVPYTPPTRARRKHTFIEGLRVLCRDRLLLFWTLGTVITEAAWQALFAAIPVLALTRFAGDVRVVGIVAGAFGIGALAGSLLAVPALRRISAVNLTYAGKLAQAVAFCGLLVPITETRLVGCLLVAGLFNGLTNGPAASVRLIRIPGPLRPQILALISAITMVGGTCGLAVGGLALEGTGERETFFGMAAAQLLGFCLFIGGSTGQMRPVRDSPPAQRDHEDDCART
jgi:predicted MFS family arabinose efflux permease